ncbi:cyclin-I [Cololabis saira]|uniref:cyclin-I n=1 Tax=Cololabis saira TaxID=129043 RepID=UPI002AD1F433|nr:cyclin-I [Cololabis saira]XP_061595428.1 cyclin-I [Cololabis saira]
MKNPGSPESRRLAGLLESALAREARLWKVPVFKNGCIQGADISSSLHQQMILWLGEMSRTFHFSPETFALGVCVLNRLLSTVKAQPKYLRCIAFTSLVLAAKINEEDEVIGSVRDLVVQSGCSFSTAEILRMERIILDKLHWDLYTATPVDFIHIFHALLVHGHPQLLPSSALGSGGASAAAAERGALPAAPGHQKRPPALQVALWSRQVQHCMACHQLWQFKGSTLALAIITLELEALTADWFSVFTDLLKKAQVDSAEFIHCKEMVDEYLHSLEFSLPANAVYIFEGAQIQERERAWGPAQRLRVASRGPERDLDEYCDGFGCLYKEEPDPAEEARDVECLFGSQTIISPCPPLHPAVI